MGLRYFLYRQDGLLFPQSVPNPTETSTNLYEPVKGGNLTVYVDEALRQAVHQAVALETSRGWRIARRSRRTESTSSSRSRRRRRASSRSGAYQRGQLPKMRAGGTNHVG